MRKTLNKTIKLIAAATVATLGGSALAHAAPVYLNISNIDVAVGAGTTSTTANNTYDYLMGIEKVIDAPTADASETHSQITHIWYSGPVGSGLELEFDFRQQYDLTTLHFWNYNGETFDVDTIEFTFFDETKTQVGALTINPALGASPAIFAEDIALAAPLNVQFVTAFLSGTNGQVDFQNIGFTASLSTDRCQTNPNDPICTPSDSVPAPAGLGLLGLGLLSLGALGRRRMA